MNELGLGPEGKTKPIRHGITTFAAFFIAGLVPLTPFFIPLFRVSVLFEVSILFTVVALFCLGALRSLVTPLSWFRGGIEILFVGSLAAGAAYFIGVLLREFFRIVA